LVLELSGCTHWRVCVCVCVLDDSHVTLCVECRVVKQVLDDVGAVLGRTNADNHTELVFV